MLDHAFVDAIGALRDALEQAFLERVTPEERFQIDVLLGDSTWESSYGLPGEGVPPRVRADITLDWSTWSQSLFRSWLRSEDLEEDPSVEVSVVFRIQRLVEAPHPSTVLAGLLDESIPVGSGLLRRTAPTVETVYTDDLVPLWHAIDVGFEGAFDLDD